MNFERMAEYTANGFDDAEFLISTNPGEPLKPLGKVASGGELSRIMLAIKTVLADEDAVETLIFDEIDSGISGRTAQMVSEKMNVLGRSHQIICITHLPQIAAMADSHYRFGNPYRIRRQSPRSADCRRREHTGAFPYAWRRGDHGDGKRECARDARACKKQKIGV